MKALVRNNDVICEPWSLWVKDHIIWLTTPRPYGDGYKLVENYSPENELKISGDPYNI